jgi:hypothetical protein
MPTISKQKKEKISEQILNHLFTISPDSQFTVNIAKEIARDEEFTKMLLLDLQSKRLVTPISKNKGGKDYLRRIRWRLTNEAYNAYKKQTSSNNNNLYISDTQLIQNGSI